MDRYFFLNIFALFVAALIAPTAHAADTRPTPVHMVIIGDSTVSDYPAKHANRGWGMYIEEHFKSGTVIVTNLAKPGRSTKTFIQEGRWKAALGEKPDYVLIQFGHNDSHDPKNPEATDAATDYKDNLRRYIDESRAIGATPILVTPMVRRNFDAEGKIANEPPPSRHLGSYADAMKEVAREKKVPVIDLYTSSKVLAEKLGPQASATMANKKGDNTHFNEKGARAMADLVMKELLVVEPRLKEEKKSP
jgi:lysophospholipase L1-like esterase